MDLSNFIVWTIYPYVVVFIMIIGLVWSYEEKEMKTFKRIKTENKFILLFVAFLLITGLTSLFIVDGTVVIIAQWLIGLTLLKPDIIMITTAPFILQLHLFSVITFFGLLPFLKTYRSLILLPIDVYQYVTKKRLSTVCEDKDNII
ncbi:respiratory nitrate reductase subunit gamma [Anaerobacillus sp. MEB173]|uniref:respiratory nitrate reductase subunit gamma n=1 Tax=Anaerobacillus sp. MEB173 TaxID=3383345 RepID=UPI003F8F0E40